MDKKWILAIILLLVVSLVFVACKGNDDVEDPTESTTESTTETTSGQFEIKPITDEEIGNSLVPEVNDGSFPKGDIIIGDGNTSGEDTISWNDVVGN